MRISAVIGIARQYLVVGSLAAILFLIGYFIIYKKLLKGIKTLNTIKLSLITILIIYIGIVLGATLGIRSSGYEGANLYLFSSYKEAWNSFSLREWRYIILNILMFVPLGIMLPLIFEKCEKWYITYLAGFVATLFIEILQLVSKRGIFELDDILNNTIGCMIGYGLVMIFISIFKNKKESTKNKVITMASYQLPLLITITTFSIIFITYSKQEIGNLSIANSYKVDMSNVNVTTKLKLQDKSQNAYVYKATIGDKKDTLELASKIFSQINKKIDESKNDEYDETIIYKTEDDKYHLWINYIGLTTSYTDFTQLESKNKEKLTDEEVKSKLSEFDINIPKEAKFTDEGNGMYAVSVDMIKSEDVYLNGNLSCTISESGIVKDFNNNIIEYKPYKEYEIISQKEAYNKFLNGEFKSYQSLTKNLEIEVKDINLKYYVDSKGFYQPVYEITTNNEQLKTIEIPALKDS